MSHNILYSHFQTFIVSVLYIQMLKHVDTHTHTHRHAGTRIILLMFSGRVRFSCTYKDVIIALNF